MPLAETLEPMPDDNERSQAEMAMMHAMYHGHASEEDIQRLSNEFIYNDIDKEWAAHIGSMPVSLYRQIPGEFLG